MPAAAVIPALIAYIKVVAVKTLVVENRMIRQGYRVRRLAGYCEEIRVFMASVSLNMIAWDSKELHGSSRRLRGADGGIGT